MAIEVWPTRGLVCEVCGSTCWVRAIPGLSDSPCDGELTVEYPRGDYNTDYHYHYCEKHGEPPCYE